MKKHLLTPFLLLTLFSLQAQSGSSYCDNLLPVSTIVKVCGDRAKGVAYKATGVVAESGTSCNRIYGIGQPTLFKDNLVLIVSQQRDAAGAQKAIEIIAKGHEQDFHYKRLADLGDGGVQFLPRSNGRSYSESVVSFRKGNLVVELKYLDFEADLNSFLLTMDQLVAIARDVAARM